MLFLKWGRSVNTENKEAQGNILLQYTFTSKW